MANAAPKWIKHTTDACPVDPTAYVRTKNNVQWQTVKRASEVNWGSMKLLGGCRIKKYQVLSEDKETGGVDLSSLRGKWVKWESGACPAALGPEDLHEVLEKSGQITTFPARMVHWEHLDHPCDVVAYNTTKPRKIDDRC